MRINSKVHKCWSVSFCFLHINKIFFKNVHLKNVNLENAPFKNSLLRSLKNNENFEKMNHPKPNYFLCFPLNNENLENELIKIQNHVVSKCNILKECVIERKKFHISLLILYIKKSQVELSIEAFNEAINTIRNISKHKITFSKLNTFNNNVLYLSVDNSCTEYLTNSVSIFKEAFKKRNIKIVKNEKKWSDKKKKKKSKEKNEEGAEEKEVGEIRYQYNDKTYENEEIKKKTDVEKEEEKEKEKKEKEEDAEKEEKEKEEKEKEENEKEENEKEENEKEENEKNSKKRNKNSVDEFIPHLTIMKNTRMKSKYKTKKKILIFEDYYSDFDLTNLLKEQMDINKFQLLEMNLDKATAYYKIVTEWNFE